MDVRNAFNEISPSCIEIRFRRWGKLVGRECLPHWSACDDQYTRSIGWAARLRKMPATGSTRLLSVRRLFARRRKWKINERRSHLFIYPFCSLSCEYKFLRETKTAPRACKWKQNKECRRRAFNSKFIILFSHSLMDCKNKYAAITLWIERRRGGGGREVGGGASVTSLGPSPWPHHDPAEFAAFRNNCSFTQNKHARAA